jgi:hypothetical protein
VERRKSRERSIVSCCIVFRERERERETERERESIRLVVRSPGEREKEMLKLK